MVKHSIESCDPHGRSGCPVSSAKRTAELVSISLLTEKGTNAGANNQGGELLTTYFALRQVGR